MTDELQGKAAIVTGASKGIGAATAEELARQGVAVVLAARSSGAIEEVAGKITAAGGKAKAIACDVASYDDVAAAVDLCTSSFGSVDILVNNAGVIEPIARLAESDPAGWGEAIDINVKGVYHGLRAVLPLMEAQGAGVIVNVSSGAATSALEGWSHYCASKAAVLMLTRCVHKEYADKGIRVVGMSPGTVATGMQISIKASGINPVSQLDPSVHISPDWPAKAIAWLCTKEASEYDGGDFSLKTEEGRRKVGLVA
ncbi:SDR family oxidoreductase [Pelagibius sp. CAU 1746]|uniref:SDR family oxidoreductase n=1 Tax=Pelagibius sp. CAU 1746 TaxID=3140370 RepID=UPI00325BAD84